MDLVKYILDCLKKGLDRESIILKVTTDESYKDVDVKDISDAYESAVKAFESTKKMDADKKDNATQKAFDDRVEKAVTEKLEAKLKEIKIPSKMDVDKEAAAPAHEYKSFIKDSIYITKADWIPQFGKMVKFLAAQNYAEVAKISNDFMQKSPLYSKKDKAEYASKVLVGDAPTGDFTVPTELSDLIFSIAQRESYIWNNAIKIPLASGKMDVSGVGDVTFTEEANQSATVTTSEPVFNQESLDLVAASALAQLHKDLISDSPLAIVQILSQAFGRGLATYQKQFTSVGSTVSGDQIVGVYSTSGIGSIAALSSGVITYDDIVNLVHLVNEVFRENASFEMNDAELKRIKKIKDDEGRPLFMNPMTGQPISTLMGFPIKINNQIPATLNPANGDRLGGTESTILFGDPKQIVMGIKGGFMLSLSTEFAFDKNRTTFLGRVRNDQAIMNVTGWGRLIDI